MTFDYNHFPGRIKGIRLYRECIICLDPVFLSVGCLTFTRPHNVTGLALEHTRTSPLSGPGGSSSESQAESGMNRACHWELCKEAVNFYLSLTFIISTNKWNIFQSYYPITREVFSLHPGWQKCLCLSDTGLPSQALDVED